MWDIERILFGQAPPSFLLEVFIRTLVIYVAAIAVLRWMGKRMNGQLSIIELSVMVMMGAIISVPMQLPERGILQGLLVLLVTLLLLRTVNWLSYRSVRLENLVHGKVSVLVKDGVLQVKELEANRLTNQQVFAVLRNRQIYNLGKVKRLYLEDTGSFSLYTEEKDKPGLPLYPPIDETIYESHEAGTSTAKACCRCGTVQTNGNEQCTCCGSNNWSKAIV